MTLGPAYPVGVSQAELDSFAHRADGLIEVFSANSIDSLATLGVITVADGENLTIDLKTDTVTSATEFVLEGSAELRFTTELADGEYLYSGTGDMISGEGTRVSVENMVIISISTGTFYDVIGATFNIQLSAIIGFTDLGSLREGRNFIVHQSSVADCASGFTVINMAAIDMVSVDFDLSAMSGPFINYTPNAVSSVIDIASLSGDLGSNTVIRIDPDIRDDTLVVLNNNILSIGELFDTSGGSTGTFTAAGDATITAQAITSVTDVGGVAQFNWTPGAVTFVDQDIVLTGMSNYSNSQTFRITDTGSGFFRISSLAFNGDDTGSFDSDSVTLTDTSTPLTDGNTLVISTDNSTDYDGGAIVYNQLTNSFQISRPFTSTQSGTWDTSGINQKDPRVLSTNNPGFEVSTAKIELSVTGNVLVTDIPAVGAKVLINSSIWTTDAIERFKCVSPDEAIFTGNEPVTVKLDGNILIEPANSAKSISCQFVRQDAARVVVTFTNSTNIVNETDTPLVDGDNMTFHDTAGTLPAELRDDVIYYVVSAAANTFQVSYTLGGAAVAFTDDGSGTNTYAEADLHGSKPQEPITSNNPRTLVPQALEDLEKGDKTFIVITNLDDAVDLELIDGYYRVSL